jgi:membrane protease subunit HflC
VNDRLSLIVRWLIAVAIVLPLLTYAVYFPVREGTAVIVTRFGRPVRELLDPGPYFKFPWPVEQTHVLDTRRRLFNTPYTATFTRDKRNVILLTYIVWRVGDPLLFLQSVATLEGGERKLDGMVTAAKNVHLGRHDLSALVSTSPEDLRTEAIEAAILDDVRGPALEKFGIAIEKVGFKRVAFPEENLPAVLANMRAERRAEANRLRAEGEKEAQAIRDDTLVKTEEILREGREEAGRIRGQAEKDAAEVYARAHKLDPDFYRFWRSLEAVRKTLGARSTIILRADQGFFDVLQDPGRKPNGEGVGPRIER